MDELGGFDPRFFLYFEETDLCRRTENLGAELWAVGEALGHHIGGASAQQSDSRFVNGCIAEHFFRSRFYYLVKHHGWAAASAADIAELLIMAARAVLRTATGGSAGELVARLRAPILRPPSREP